MDSEHLVSLHQFIEQQESKYSRLPGLNVGAAPGSREATTALISQLESVQHVQHKADVVSDIKRKIEDSPFFQQAVYTSLSSPTQRAQHTELCEHVHMLKFQLEALEIELLQLRDSKAEVEENSQRMQQQLERVTGESERQVEEVEEDSKRQVEGLLDLIAELENDAERAQSSCEVAVIEATRYAKQQAEAMTSRMQMAAEMDVDGFNLQIADLERRLQAAEKTGEVPQEPATLQRLNSELTNLWMEARQHADTLAHEKEEMNGQLELQRGELNIQIENLQESCESAHQQAEFLAKQDLQNRKAILEGKKAAEALKFQLAAEHNEHERAKLKSDAQKEKVIEEKAQLQAQLEEVTVQRNQMLAAQLEALQGQLNEARQEREKAIAIETDKHVQEKLALEQQLSESAAQRNELVGAQLAVLEAQIQKELQNSAAAADHEREKLKSEKMALEQQLEESTAKRSQMLAAQLAALRAQMDEMQTKQNRTLTEQELAKQQAATEIESLTEKLKLAAQLANLQGQIDKTHVEHTKATDVERDNLLEEKLNLERELEKSAAQRTEMLATQLASLHAQMDAAGSIACAEYEQAMQKIRDEHLIEMQAQVDIASSEQEKLKDENHVLVLVFVLVFVFVYLHICIYGYM